MYYTLVFISILLLLYFYKKSKSNFFNREDDLLNRDYDRMTNYLNGIESTKSQCVFYQTAYKYFRRNKDKYDGATIVKDLIHIKGIDINAMLHDYMYLKYKVSANIYYKFLADYVYAKEMERCGKGMLAWVNFILLTISTVFWMPYVYFYKGIRMTKEDKLLFTHLYENML